MSLLENLFSQGVVERLGWMLLHFLWQAAVVAAVLAVFLRLLRGAGASLRYIVACCALLLMVVLPVVTMQLVEVEGPAAEPGPPAVTAPRAMEPLTPTEVQIVDEMPPFAEVAPPLETADLATPVSLWERIASVLEPTLPYLVLAWLAGVLGLSTWHLGGWMQLQRLRQRMVRQVGTALLAKSRELASRLGVRRAVMLLESALVEVPTVVGWLRPVILLPASALTGLNPEQLEAILAHELAHIRRCDYLVNILQTLVEILGFFHPALWWVSHRIRVERENCCDDVAVRLCGDSVRYARALTHLEEIRHRWTELAIAASGGSLIERIARLLGQPVDDDRRFAWLPGLIALLLVVGLVIPAALALAAPDTPLVANRVDFEPDNSGQARDIPAMEAKTQAQAGEEPQDPVQILVKFSLFPKVSLDKAVDRETRLLIGQILAAENPQALDDIAGLGSKQNATLGQILRTWVVDRHLAPETIEVLIDVLQSRGYLTGEATPEVLVNNNTQARINVITEEEWYLPPADPESPLKRIELGTFVQVTPHLSSLTSDRITLEMAMEWRERAKQDDPSNAPAIRSTETATTVTLPRNRCFTLLVEPDNAESTDSESLLVTFSADRFESGAKQDNASVPQVQPTGADVPPEWSDSQAWYIMRQWNCPPLLLGLTQQFAKVLVPSRGNDPAWREVTDGGMLRLEIDVEGDEPPEVTIGLFKDARWLDEPVAIRQLPGAGTYTLTGLPAGRYQIGAMVGEAPVPLALGVHRTWPQAVEIGPNRTATAEVLVSEAFQKWASGWYNQEVAKDYLGQWGDLDEANLLQGKLTGPDGKPIPFGMIEIREHNPGANSIATADQGTNERGIYKYDGMAWPYRIGALWREAIPSAFGYRGQRIHLSRVLEGPQRLDFRFEPFPEGTAKVAGRVVDQKGQPVKGFFLRVHVPPFDDLDLSGPTGGSKTQVTYDVPFISDEGTFELAGLPAGRATVDPIPFEIQRYQRERSKDILLEADKTADVEFRFLGKDIFYGRVLFEDGTAAVVTPAPWRGAATRILMPSGGTARSIAEVDADGYFTVYLDDSETQALVLGNSRLVINVPTDQERRWETAGQFPYEKLSAGKSKAGVVTVKRPEPTPMLPMHLRSGGPLPQGWKLDYQEWTGSLRRATGVSLHARLDPSHSQNNRPVEIERFELYDPEGKRTQSFHLGSTLLLDKAQRYTVIGRLDGSPAGNDWRIRRGPFTLDLSRPGRYTLTGIAPSTTGETVAETQQIDAHVEREIEVECRFVLVDDEWMDAFTQGLPIPGVTSPDDVNALHEIGAGLSADDAPPLTPDQVGLLLKAVGAHRGSSMLAAPRVTVLDGERASLSVSDRLNYISGYTEPNDPSQEPIPHHESQTIGLTYDITPRLDESHNSIRIEMTADIRSLLEIRKLTYENVYEYEVPVFKDIHIQSETTLPNGWTALLLGDKIPALTGAQAADDTPPRHLLVLIRAARTDAPPPPPTTVNPPADSP